MKRNASLYIRHIFIFSFLLFLFILPFVLPQEAKNTTQDENINNKSKIIDEIKNLNFWDGFCYASDFVYTEQYRDAVFASEWLLGKHKEESEKYPIFYHNLGAWCSFIKEFDKSFEYYTKAYKLQNYPHGIPENPEEKKKIEIDAYLFVIHEMYKNSNQFVFLIDECMSLAIKFKQLYPENSDKVSWVFYNIELEKKEKAEFAAVQKNIMKLGQEFLDKEAEFVNKKDKDGLYKFLLNNCASEEKAKSFTESNIEFFFTYTEVTFNVINAAPCLGEGLWCITFRWWTKPKHTLQGSDSYVQTFITVKIIDGKLILVQ